MHTSTLFQINGTNELIYKTETVPQIQKTNLQIPGLGGGGMINWEFGIEIHTAIYKIDN